MARRQSAFTEADIRRALRAVQKAGMPISSVEIDRDGRIQIRALSDKVDVKGEFDLWLEKHAG